MTKNRFLWLQQQGRTIDANHDFISLSVLALWFTFLSFMIDDGTMLQRTVIDETPVLAIACDSQD